MDRIMEINQAETKGGESMDKVLLWVAVARYLVLWMTEERMVP